MSATTPPTIAVTGLSSGIGAATAALLQSRGARIIGFDRHPPAFEVDGFHPVDLGDKAAIEACAARAPGGLDALVNCAGLPPTADARSVLMVNFFGLRHFTEAMVPRLADGAAIVNVASLAGFGWRANIRTVTAGMATAIDAAPDWIAAQRFEGGGSYFLSKELLIAWTMWECQRWRSRGLRMVSVSPGPVATPILPDFIQTLGQRVANDLRENRAATAEEIAPVIAFLTTPDARWINGADIAVDAGAGATAWRQLLA